MTEPQRPDWADEAAMEIVGDANCPDREREISDIIRKQAPAPGTYEHNAVERPTCEGWWWRLMDVGGIVPVYVEMPCRAPYAALWWGPIVPPVVGANLRP